MKNSDVSFNALHSMLFVPALSERFIANAHARGADAVIFDLEDSIPPDHKIAARDALGSAVARVRPHGLPVLVRVNNLPHLFEADLHAAAAAGVDAVLIPKVDTPDLLREADLLMSRFERDSGRTQGTISFIALVESPLGLLNVAQIAQSGGRLRGLGFGSEDFAAVLGIAPEVEAMSLPAQQIALAARAYGLAAWGLPGSIADFGDLDAFEKLLHKAKAYGFTGALGIHPKQVELINRVFRPSAAELAHAQRVIDAYESALANGAGAVALDGKMIDAPVVERARRLLRGGTLPLS
jgi:citrate lyase subunit beta/citryl-CoA lyase